MNYKSLKRAGIDEPMDGFSDLEKELGVVLMNNTIHSIYSKLPTNRMKFIVAAHFELGYPQDLVAEMLDIRQPSLRDEINLIQRILLGKKYRPQKRKKAVNLEDVMKILMYLKYN